MAYEELVEVVTDALDEYIEASKAYSDLTSGSPRTDEEFRERYDKLFRKQVEALQDALLALATCDADDKEIRAVATRRLAIFDRGDCTVVVERQLDPAAQAGDVEFLRAYAVTRCGFAPDDAEELWERLEEIGPQELVADASFADAVTAENQLGSSWPIWPVATATAGRKSSTVSSGDEQVPLQARYFRDA